MKETGEAPRRQLPAGGFPCFPSAIPLSGADHHTNCIPQKKAYSASSAAPCQR